MARAAAERSPTFTPEATVQGFERISVRRAGGRLDLRLARAEQRNALDFQAWDELGTAMRDLVAADDSVHVVTLTGDGPAFCAGVDFEAIGASLEVERGSFPSFIRRWADVADGFERVAQPTVALLNGATIGAGLEIALACDIRIASERAVFAMPQLQMGIVPDVGGTSRLARATGEAVAKDLILTGRVMDAEEALRTGIVSRVVAHDELAAVGDQIADTIADLPWPAPYFANVAIEAGSRLDSRRAADIEAMADQVMLREDVVWERIQTFMDGRGLKGRPR
jgi:enoyl-CoA hydratase/carnithine racemase